VPGRTRPSHGWGRVAAAGACGARQAPQEGVWETSRGDAGGRLHNALAAFAEHMQWAFIYDSVARAQELATSDVDAMIIGRVGLADLAPALR